MSKMAGTAACSKHATCFVYKQFSCMKRGENC